MAVIERSPEVIDMILNNSEVGKIDKITVAPGDAFDYGTTDFLRLSRSCDL